MSVTNSSPFDKLIQRACEQPARIVLPEGADPRVLQAALSAMETGSANPVLLGEPSSIEQQAKELNLDISELEIINPATSRQRSELAAEMLALREHKGMTPEKAKTVIADNLHFACMMVQQGLADGCVGGAVYPTADVVRTALQLVGKHPQSAFVSSFFIMLMNRDTHPIKDIALFADCALAINPDSEQLAEIAICTGGSAQQLLGIDPQIGMLSFSTMGSGKHEMVDKVAEAARLAKARRTDWRIVGEVQLDAAVIPDVLRAKAPSEATDQPLNILVFPNLDAGNIGVKICERFGGAQAIGPVLQGLAKPVNDLSRGCKTEDIANIIGVTSAQCQST